MKAGTKNPSHSLAHTLRNVNRNGRLCVFTEPLWGIPNSLYAPFVALYMTALGLTDLQIGMCLSIGLFVQSISALMSGVLADKFGRRWTTFLFDLFCWSVPCALWAMAQDVRWFIAAAMFNGMYRVTANSWTMLLIEDAEPDQVVHLFVLVYVAAQLGVFVAPIASPIISHYTLVPTVRILYWFACVCMTLKFALLFFFGTETRIGMMRKAACKGKSLLRLLFECKDVFLSVFRSPRMLIVMGIILATNIMTSLNSMFWIKYVGQVLGAPDAYLTAFPVIKSAVQLTLYFTLVPRLSADRFKKPMLTGMLMFALSLTLFLLLPTGIAGTVGGMLLPLACAALEAAALAITMPLVDSLLMLNMEPEVRSRVYGMIYSVIILAAVPFGGLGGRLSDMGKGLPFVLLIGVALIGALLVALLAARQKDVARVGAGGIGVGGEGEQAEL